MDILLEFTFGCKKKKRVRKKVKKNHFSEDTQNFFNNDNILTFLT